MNKQRKINFKLDEELYRLIQCSEGKSLSDKTRNLVMQALNVKQTYQTIEGES